MSKKNISATVDPEVADYLQQEDVNASGTVNRLVKQEMGGGLNESEMLRLRLDRERDSLEDLRGQVERKEERIERLEERLKRLEKENQQETEEAWNEAIDALSGRLLTTDMQPVQHWAEVLDVEPSEVIQRVQDAEDE